MTDNFKALLEQRHENARRWKGEGKKIIGYICSYGLEEILHAAGLQPVRIFGPGGPYELSKEHIQPYYCQHCHGSVDEALKGNYDYLNGLVFPYTCEHGRAVYDSWRANVKIDYTRFIDMPSQTDLSQAEEFFVEELKNFSSSLESAFDTRITKEGLQASIKLHNRNRTLLKEIYGLQVADEPLVSGTEVFSAVMSSTVSRKEEHNDLLEGFLRELGEREDPAGAGPRLMLIGTELHDTEVVKTIEEADTRVVVDELCTGTRLVWENVDEKGEPLTAIARRYLTGINCPIKRPAQGRMAHLEKMADEFKVEGVLVLHPKHCDPNEWDMPFILETMKQKDIPVMKVELDDVFSPDHIRNAVDELKSRL